MAQMNETPSGERTHIAFFGKRNAGKSSLMNAFTGQQIAIVSDYKGTTTDPVQKAMELLPLGPVLVIDTPGLDDIGELGAKRIEAAERILRKTDIALLIADNTGTDEDLGELLNLASIRGIPYIIVHNKSDLLDAVPAETEHEIWVSALTGANITRLKEKTAALIKGAEDEKKLIRDLLDPGDVCVLVVPIDKAAPKGRLILPQQQAIRDVLEGGASAHICRETELADTLNKLAGEPRLVVTDSQVFGAVSRIVPNSVPLTSFSILMARYKGDLGVVCRGAFTVDGIKDGDKILISEGCTHHRQCGDIGTEKLPAWIRKHTGVCPQFEFTSGTEFPKDVTPYRLVVHCGGCTLREKEMKWRIGTCVSQGVPITNYGILIAHLNGILARATEMFPEVLTRSET